MAVLGIDISRHIENDNEKVIIKEKSISEDTLVLNNNIVIDKNNKVMTSPVRAIPDIELSDNHDFELVK